MRSAHRRDHSVDLGSDVDCIVIALLALMVQSEAPNEPLPGKIAVAYVAMNRAEASGRTVQDILTQPRQFKINLRLHVSESSAYAAWVALNHLQPDPTNGAEHFYNASIRPWPSWYNEQYMTARIGHHTFLKLGGF